MNENAGKVILITLPKRTRAEAFAAARATVNAIYATRPQPHRVAGAG